MASQADRDSVDITNLRVANNAETNTTTVIFDLVDLSKTAGDQLFFDLNFPDEANDIPQVDYLRARRGSQKITFHDYPADKPSLMYLGDVDRCAA